jgi:hypothetical protein
MPAITPAKILPVALKRVRLKLGILIVPAAAIFPGIQRIPAKDAVRKTWLKPEAQAFSIVLQSINARLLM